MERLARDFATRARFLFVYVREAHPGEVYPHHTSSEQKHRHAAALRDLRQAQRPFLIDTLDGEVHRRYGGVSNMTWIIDHTGRVAFRASWTVAEDVRAALEETLRVRELRREGRPVTAYYREVMGLRPASLDGDEETRYLGGKKALADVRKYRQAG